MMDPKQLKERTKGMVVITTTPFNKDDEVDYAGLRSNIDYIVSELHGKDACLVATGSTGEFYALSDEERREVIKTTVETVNGRLPVYAGTAEAGTKKAMAWSRYAESVGADGVMVVLPYYHVPTEEGMYLHYKQIAESVNIGVMIYNNASVSGCWIRPDLMARLADIDNIIADKENSRFIQQQSQMLSAIDPKKMNVLVGTGEIPFSHLSLFGNSPGYISVEANFAPKLFYSFWEAAEQNDYARIKQLLVFLQPYYRLRGRLERVPHCSAHGVPYSGPVTYLSLIKEAMNVIGLCGGHVRLPLVDLPVSDVPELKSILEGMGVLSAGARV